MVISDPITDGESTGTNAMSAGPIDPFVFRFLGGIGGGDSAAGRQIGFGGNGLGKAEVLYSLPVKRFHMHDKR
jgi:hypothetical protein